MTASAIQVLSIAADEIGFDEGRNNSNKYAPAVGHANNQPWCMSYVVWCFKEAGAAELMAPGAYTPTGANWFKERKQTVPLKASLWRPGDVLFFQWPGMGRIAHIGLLEKVLSPTKIQVLEGNTNAAGSRTGGSVLRKVRDVSQIAVVGRPLYASKGTAPKTAPAKTAAPALKSPGIYQEAGSAAVWLLIGSRRVWVQTREDLNVFTHVGIGGVTRVPKGALSKVGIVGPAPK